MENDSFDYFDDVVKRLSYVTRRVEHYGRMVVYGTIAHVAFGLLSIIFRLMPDGLGIRAFSIIDVGISLLIFDFFIMIFCVLTLVNFENVVKRGEIYFGEIANEKNWQGEDEGVLRFRYRIALRQFSLSSELPLARGRLGVSLYLLINVAITFSVWVAVLLVITQQNVRF